MYPNFWKRGLWTVYPALALSYRGERRAMTVEPWTHLWFPFYWLSVILNSVASHLPPQIYSRILHSLNSQWNCTVRTILRTHRPISELRPGPTVMYLYSAAVELKNNLLTFIPNLSPDQWHLWNVSSYCVLKPCVLFPLFLPVACSRMCVCVCAPGLV